MTGRGVINVTSGGAVHGPMPDPLVTIATFRDLPEALLAQGKLEAGGIESFLADDNVVRMDWFWANAVGGVKLQVREEEAESALDLLAEAIPEELPSEMETAYQQPRCPKCGSLDVRHDRPEQGLRLAVLYLVPLLLPGRRKRWMCDSCGAHWRDDAESPL